MNHEAHQAFRLSSPMLDERGESLLSECPTGYVLRNAPYVYQAINMNAHVESGAVNPMGLSAWTRDALGVVGSERTRLRLIEDDKRKAKNDSAAGRRTLKAG